MSFCANEKTLPQWRKGAMHLENVQIAGSDWLQSHILRLHHVILCWPKAVSPTHLQIRKRMPSHQACIETWTALLVCHLGVGTNIYQLISQHVKIFQYVNVSSRCILYILPAWEVEMQSNARNSCTPKNLKIKAAKATDKGKISVSQSRAWSRGGLRGRSLHQVSQELRGSQDDQNTLENAAAKLRQLSRHVHNTSNPKRTFSAVSGRPVQIP